MTEPPTIAVHGSKFHCDDATAVALLRHLPWLKDAKVIRTLDNAVLSSATVVADIGGEYDHKKHRYDHHQKGFSEVFCEKTRQVKMAATGLRQLSTRFQLMAGIGLIWRHFGRELIRILHANENLSDVQVERLHRKVYVA